MSENRELLCLTSPVSLSVEVEVEAPEGGEPDKRVYVKGFASVRTVDRAGDLVDPEEFNIPQFMAAPTLLVNHNLWIDEYGNGVAAGRPIALYACRLVQSDSPDNWGVQDLRTKKVVSDFPKAKVPNLALNDRGLFVVAEVTQEDVAEMVDRGELQAFSWRGLVRVDYEVNSDGSISRVFKDVDLYEISLTHVPENPDSTLIIGKSVVEAVPSALPVAVHIVRLDKDRFVSKGMAAEFLKAHSLGVDAVREDDKSYYSLQRQGSDFDLTKLVAVKMVDGVFAIAGPLKEPVKKTQPQGWFGSLLASKTVSDLAGLYPDGQAGVVSISKEAEMPEGTQVQSATVSTTGEVKTDAEKTAAAAVATPETAKPAVPAVDPAKEQLESLSAHVATKTAQGVVEGLKPVFDAFNRTLTGLGSTLTQVAEKMANIGQAPAETKTEMETETKSEVQKSAGVLSLETLAAGLLAVNGKVEDVKKSVQGIGATPTAAIVRDEKVETQKGADSDPNAAFNGLWPFLG